jgi:hypothetical protein
MRAIVHAADVQDRDGGALLMAALFGAFPFLTRLFADGGYQGPQFKHACCFPRFRELRPRIAY